ncbi:UDP-glycosyltransferase UGT5 [Leptinotarsa decemlineata]|uniref:UDP-glycosyltransferase UGT5 n=1 Tax=Leptinotarsa decemlineata TaxID=7539 RepID=UPI003D304521
MEILYNIIVLLQAAYLGNSFKILVVFPMPSPSHFILGNSLARGLVEAGHDVTMVSSFEDKNPPRNGKYTSVKLEGMKDILKSADENVDSFDLADMNPFNFISVMDFMGNVITNTTLTNANFKKLINSDQKFDVVMIEQFKNDALRVLACHYQAPLVIISTMEANSWVNSLVGNPSPPSYIPDVFLGYTRNMNIWQRSVNSLMYIKKEISHRLFFTPVQNELARKHFPKCVDENGPIADVSLLLLNSHESINDPVPYVPNMVNIGGYHVNPPKRLPKDLQEYCDSAEHGVIYFSMGSNLKTSNIPQDIQRAILNTLRKLKQKVLWKWDEDHVPDKPENVKMEKWFPQQDILAHPNVRLFITHGGLLSTTETIYHGVPILAIPIYGDQKMNAAKAVAAEYGLSLSINEISEEKLSNNINELLNDPKYRDNAKRRSAIMHDRKVKPMDLATYWIEFVVRHKGAPHLSVAALDLTWYQYFLVDIVLLVGAVVASLMLASYFILKKIVLFKGK